MEDVEAYLELVGRTVREERERRGWSLRDLKDRTSMTRPHLSGIERGRVRFNMETLIRLARALEVSPMFLLCPKDRAFRELLRSPGPLTSEGQLMHLLVLGVSSAVIHQHKPEPEVLQRLGKALLDSSPVSDASHALLEAWLSRPEEKPTRRTSSTSTGVLLECNETGSCE